MYDSQYLGMGSMPQFVNLKINVYIAEFESKLGLNMQRPQLLGSWKYVFEFHCKGPLLATCQLQENYIDLSYLTYLIYRNCENYPKQICVVEEILWEK